MGTEGNGCSHRGSRHTTIGVMRRLMAAAFGVTAPCVRTLKNVLNNEGSLLGIQRGCEVSRNVADYALSSGVALGYRELRFWGLLGGSCCHSRGPF
ncbi:hypothetical protein AVEN_169805-1 [Araneus ventricosus]|uniref:Uncharacterized protein n=1 Tax=Araneus ventricosus TaxID=182803 RepID=A0A4Y2PD98_ARAVE|nr:hypothetical protein AVEN_169805-1 [Araneus ventricosus]